MSLAAVANQSIVYVPLRSGDTVAVRVSSSSPYWPSVFTCTRFASGWLDGGTTTGSINNFNCPRFLLCLFFIFTPIRMFARRCACLATARTSFPLTSYLARVRPYSSATYEHILTETPKPGVGLSTLPTYLLQSVC